MSTSLLYHAFGIRGYQYTRTDYQDGQVIFTIHQEPETCRCSACGSPPSHLSGRGRAAFPIPAHRQSSDVGRPAHPDAWNVRHAGWCVRSRSPSPTRDGATPRRSSGTRWSCRGRMTIRDVAAHLDVGWDVIKDIQKRDLSRRYRQAQAQTPAAHRHRRDRHRQGASLSDGGHGLGERGGGLRRRRQGGRCAEAVLEAAAAQRGQDRGGGHGHVGGVPRGGLDPPAQGEDRLRPLPCHQALLTLSNCRFVVSEAHQ